MRFKFLIYFFTFFFFFQASIANAASIGQMQDFFTDAVFADKERTDIKATLRFEGEHAYYYIDNEYFDSLRGEEAFKILTSLKKISLEYDLKIYPTLTKEIGQIREPGLDNDNKIYILFLKLKEGNGGYMNTADLFLKSQTKDVPTNEKEMIYLNADLINSDDINAILSHELQHLISAYFKEIQKNIADDIWLNEMRSEYAVDVLGYNNPYKGSFLESRSLIFEKNPEDSIVGWRNNQIDYAVVSILGYYLVENFGKDIFKETLKSDKIGIDSINDALKNLGFSVSFADIFKKWQIANYLNDENLFGKGYGYLNPSLNFKIKPSIFHEVFEGDIKEFNYIVDDWQLSFLEYYGNVGKINIEFEGKDNSVFDVSYILNRRDKSSLFGSIKLENNRGYFSIDDLGGDISSIVLLPFSKTRLSDFAKNDIKRNFVVRVSTGIEQIKNVIISIVDEQTFKEGLLIRPVWDFKVYSVNKSGYIRHIINQKILSFYKFSDIAVVDRDDFNFYKESSLVRAENDYKIYYIDSFGVKHWLEMTAEKFLMSGRKFDSVFQISKNELELYKNGNNIID
ncbi:MAG: hypothetical protein AAB614_01210 [Patescibacteria group bacterium]